jgi:hypothetical protein
MVKIIISGVSGFVPLLGVTSSPIIQLELRFRLAAWAQSEYHGLGVHALCNRLQDVSGQLKRWSFESFGSVQKEIKRLKTQLAEAKINALVSDSIQEVRALERQLHELFEREEVMYRQRSRQEWLKAGDRNTIFFQN